MSGTSVERWLFRAASLCAISGGLLLCAMAVITVVSILGRALFSAPIPGDFEIVAMGTGIVAFLCLPWCQLKRGHVRIDLFMGHGSPRLIGVLDAFGGLLSAAIAALFAWRMALGLGEALRDHDITVILGMPLWWAYPFGIGSFALLAACCLYTARRDLRGDR